MKTNKITVMGITLISSALLLGGCSNGVPANEQSSGDVSQSTVSAASENVVPEIVGRYSENVFDNVDVKTDIVYAQKKDYLGNDIQLKLDVYLPEGDTCDKRPVIIWVHGGGMYVGSKSESWDPVSFLANDFAKKGYVFVSVDYRLNPEWEATNAFLETLKNAAEDVASSVDWIKANADEYGIDSSRIVIAGHSAGAEIADNYYFSSYLVNDSEYDKSGIKAVISASGNRLFFDGEKCTGNGAAKCLIIHGEADDINPLSDAQTFLTQLGDKGEMTTMPDNGHMWTETEEQKEFLINATTEFLLENVI
ncbi:MAG: alpha/beta hydrolase [Oscillospiraceae bacterium]